MAIRPKGISGESRHPSLDRRRWAKRRRRRSWSRVTRLRTRNSSRRCSRRGRWLPAMWAVFNRRHLRAVVLDLRPAVTANGGGRQGCVGSEPGGREGHVRRQIDAELAVEE
ncbi:hypothetical protein Dimus_024574 [Dionaea muscipula]